jgi:hypothetical protein
VNGSARLQQVFDFIDGAGINGGTGEAMIRLRNMDLLTIRAGGPGVHSWPAEPTFQQYEVLLDHEPPRFWNRYTDANGMLFSRVPKLLVTHHVTRHGGIVDMTCERTVRERIGFFKVEMLLPEASQKAILDAVSCVKGVRLTKSEFLTT